MSKEERFEWYYCDGIENMVVVDTITKSEYVDDNIANLLNQQDQEIQELKDSLYQANMELYKMSNLENENKELKKQLENAIGKFKRGDFVYEVGAKRQIYKVEMISYGDETCFIRCSKRNIYEVNTNSLFKTEEDAKISVELYYSNIPKNYKKDKLSNVYYKMKERCCNTNSKSYKNYGARGITICEEWLSSKNAFKEWAFNNGYEENFQKNGRNLLTLDRIDNDKGYCPENCRWVTQKEQQNNRKNNIAKLEELKGKRKWK